MRSSKMHVQWIKGSARRGASFKIRWTLIELDRNLFQQVVNNQDNSEIGEDAGPLAEIEFWRSRSIDLSGIRAQLDQKVGLIFLSASRFHRVGALRIFIAAQCCS